MDSEILAKLNERSRVVTEVGDGEEAAKALWREAGLRVVPGAYMSAPGPDGEVPNRNFIRVALVHEAGLIEAALARLVEIL